MLVWGDFVRLGEDGAIGDANNGDEDDMVLSWNGSASSGRQNAGAGYNKEAAEDVKLESRGLQIVCRLDRGSTSAQPRVLRPDFHASKGSATCFCSAHCVFGC